MLTHNHTLTVVALAATLCSCAHPQPRRGGAPVTRSTPAANPLLEAFSTPHGVPPFAAIRPEHFVPAIKAGAAAQLAEVRAVVEDRAAPSFDNTIAALDYSGEDLIRSSRVFHSLLSAHTNDTLDEVAKQVTPLLSAHRDRILQDAGLFARIKKVYQAREGLELTPEQKTLLRETYVGFVRGGAELDAAGKTALKKINSELALAMLQFNQNVRKEDNASALVLERKADLDGLPARVVEAAAQAAREQGKDGKWVITLHKPSLFPFLTYSRRRDLRERMFSAYIRRGAGGNKQDNRALIKTIMTLRLRKAALLGSDTWAAFALDRRMARTPANVRKLLDRVWKGALPAAKREVEAMQAIIDAEEKPAFKLAPWDWWYYAEKVRQAKYDLDDDALRPYFKLENVLQKGAFWVAGRLYGLRFTERKDLPVYHPEVRVFQVKEKNGDHLGLLYVDYFPRKSKRGGAWCGELRGQMLKGGQRVAPLVTNVGNFTRPTRSQPSLLSLEEVNTLFHEFGHALHSLLSRTTYPSSGDNIKVDFVELPSQIMENWALEPEVLKRYALHHKSGEVMPRALMQKLARAQHFNQGFATVEYLAASYLDLAWHQLESMDGVEVAALEARAMKELGLIPQIVPRYTSTNFRHIFASDFYAAGYYSYMWSEVLDADAFDAFKERGLFDPATAKAFRELLERGGAEDPALLYRRFRKAEPSVEPLLRRRGLLAPASKE